jgi:hypothetical protein
MNTIRRAASPIQKEIRAVEELTDAQNRVEKASAAMQSAIARNAGWELQYDMTVLVEAAKVLKAEYLNERQKNEDVLKLIDFYEDLLVHVDHMPTERSRIKKAFQDLSKLRENIGIEWDDDGKAHWKEKK